VWADLVNRDEIRMIERSRRARFLLEALQPVGIGDEGCGEDLDGNVTPDLRVPGPPHLSIPPAPMRETISNEPSFVPLLIVMEGKRWTANYRTRGEGPACERVTCVSTVDRFYASLEWRDVFPAER
jgi:hypothetical protein